MERGFTGNTFPRALELVECADTDSFYTNQPHIFSGLNRHGLDKNIKPSVASLCPDQSFHNYGNGIETFDGNSLMTPLETLSAQFLNIDGLKSRDLMPYPHDPFRKPALWRKYDHLSIKASLDAFPDTDPKLRQIFEVYVGLLGCNGPSQVSFTEVLRWYALGGHTMAGAYKLSGVYKLGKEGMTSFARAILSEYQGDLLFKTQVSQVI